MKLLEYIGVVLVCGIIVGLYQAYGTETPATVADYNLGNCSFISDPEKIMVCFDFNQDGKSLGAYAGSTMPTIFLRTTNSKTIRHEVLHHLLERDTDLTEEQQHKFIKDFEIIETEIFKLTYN